MSSLCSLCENGKAKGHTYLSILYNTYIHINIYFVLAFYLYIILVYIGTFVRKT